MDRNKPTGTGRGSKSKLPQHPQDIFALGSKTSLTVSRDSEKRTSIHKPSTSGVERKRDGASLSSVPSSKKPKVSASTESAVPSSSLDIEPVHLVSSVLHALDTHNSDKLLSLLTGSIRLLKSQRWKPDPVLCMSLLYLAKIRPNMFAHDVVSLSLCGLLKREQGTAFKSKGNPLVFVLACNMLYAGHRESKNWPETFIHVYIEDALNERWWVDCVWCKCLTENIITAFNTTVPPPHLIPSESNTLGTLSPSGSPLVNSNEEEGEHTELEYTVFPRYSTSYETVEAVVLEAIKEQLGRRATPDSIGKGFLKLLSATCGFPEIRMISACRLEGWLHSGKLWRVAQELLAHVCCNVDASGPTAQRDHEVLAQLARMRLKTKPLVASYLASLREMVSERPPILRSVVTHTIFNELSNVRSPNNMAVLASLINAQPQAVPSAMAQTYHELLMRPEEYLRPLRTLTRECVRAARTDAAVALHPLARALAAPPSHEPTAEVRERAFTSLADLLCLCCMLTASHAKHLPEYKQQICTIQGDATTWLFETAMSVYKPSHQEFTHALHKIMFLEPADVYSKVDNWPPESERTLTYRMCCEVPLPQPTLLRIIFIGLSKELPVSPGEAFELVEQLVRRACALPPEENPLPVDKIEAADYIFQLCQYHHPDNIALPAGYTAPSLAITSLYWRAWLVLVMIAAHNPDTFAKEAFHKYPTLKALIEMCITNKFTIDWATATDTEAERASILQLETHLAQASNAKLPITEHTSRLLSQLTMMEPLGAARRPPLAVCEVLQQLCTQQRLGRLLCRQQALLLDIVERHGTRRAMPWLHDLLHNSHHSLSVLPVQCLCEFLVAGGSGSSGGGEAGGGKALELAQHLRRTLQDSEEGARAVMHYYLQRLAHAQALVRNQANRGLKLVLTPVGAEETSEADWSADVGPEEWLSLVWSLRHWEGVRVEVVTRVRAACLVECHPKHLAAYIAFLAQYATSDACTNVQHLQDIILDLSQVMMERMSVMSNILPPAEMREGQRRGSEESALGPHHTLFGGLSKQHPRELSGFPFWFNQTVHFEDLSQVMMERMSVMSSILPPAEMREGHRRGSEESALGPHHTLFALHTLFHNYMQKVREPRSETDSGYEWCASQERVLLQWPGGEHCTIHVLVAHASVKLLCYGASDLDESGMYEWSLALWLGPEAPAAFLVDTSEEALLLPDWLRLHLVRSARPALVVAGLKGLDAQKLALFIQTFGMPVYSMSALLSALDTCPASDVLRLGVERGYMAQLVKVQHARGAAGGEAFSSMLQLREPTYPEDNLFAEQPVSLAAGGPPSEDAWGDLKEEQGLSLEQVGPLFATAFLRGHTFHGDVDQGFTQLQALISEEVKRVKQASATASDCPYIQCMVIYMGMILTSGSCQQFVVGFLKQVTYSVPLTRMLLACKGTDLEQSLVNVADSLLQHYKTSSGALVAILKEMAAFALGESMDVVAKVEVSASAECSVVLPKLKASKEEIITILERGTPISLEDTGNRLIETQDTSTVLEAICAILEKSQGGAYETAVKCESGGAALEHIFSRSGLGCGLLIDWMSELQPEILGEDPTLQMRLMFREDGAAWRPLLVAQLAHRASWSTLHTCITTLLKPGSGWRASSILELVSALTRSPRVWQGRDKTTPKHHTPEDILRLTHEQLGALVSYILEEAATPAYEPESACRSIESRLPLLLECSGRDESSLLCAVLGAEEQLAQGSEVARIFLLLFYMKVPKILKLMSESGAVRGAAATLLAPSRVDDVVDTSTSIVDQVSHTLLTAMAAAAPSKDWSSKKVVRMEAACRGLWVRHWRLGARGLSLCAALLQGLAQRLSWHALRGSALHAHVLSAVEVTPDHALFHLKHSKELHSILECLMWLAANHGGMKEAAGLLHRTAALLRRYAAHRPQQAAAFIQAHRDTISSVPPLSSLAHVGWELSAPASSAPPPHALLALQRRIAPSDELHWALQEVEAWGVRRGGAWGGGTCASSILRAAAPLAADRNNAVRTAAISLLTKLLPAVDDTEPGVQAVLQCLDSPHADVALSALEKLPELLVAMQEHAAIILMKAFELGVKSRVRTDKHIAKCVNTLNLHRGC